MLRVILKELKHHAPFTFAGAACGILFMLIFRKMPPDTARNFFYVFHPLHVFLSALVTTSIFRLHTKGRPVPLVTVLLIGYFGSVGIATLSDSLIPYLGESLLNLPNRGVHLGFIEEFWLVNPMAFLGIAAALIKPATKFTHSGHVLLSTWASLFHILMALGGYLAWASYLVILFFLFIAVWIPCCVSDIIFPLLFLPKSKISCCDEK
ncbi:MAG: hypothetical protein V1925_00010 [Candidatus Omnitrophota bacterium]